jgi:hypothetical protein
MKCIEAECVENEIEIDPGQKIAIHVENETVGHCSGSNLIVQTINHSQECYVWVISCSCTMSLLATNFGTCFTFSFCKCKLLPLELKY